MAYEDFTTYVKLGTHVGVTATKCAAVELSNDVVERVCADKGAGHFVFPTGLTYGWDHEFIFTIHEHEGTPTCVIWAVSNVVADATAWELNDAQAIGLNILRPVDPDQYAFALVNYETGQVQGSSYASYAVDTPYRVRIFSTSAETFGRVTCQIHLPTGEMVDDFSLTANRKSYRYLFPVNSIDEADSDSWISFDVENLDLNETPTPTVRHFSQPARADARQAAAAQPLARFAAIFDMIKAGAVARADARQAALGRRPARFDARQQTGRGRTPAGFDARRVLETLVPARFTARGNVSAGPCVRHNAIVAPGWALVARNVDTDEVLLLGFIDADADPAQLADVPLDDGVWEIDARPSEWFWDRCRGRRVTTLVTATGAEPTSGLPVIQDLRSEINTSFKTVIRWSVALETDASSFNFGLWFSPTSPVDTSGAPDVTVRHFEGQGDYKSTRVQTAAEYVAVAAFTADDLGPVSELELPWDTDASASPANQLAVRALATWAWP